MTEYHLDGETVEKVYESYGGDYWVITDDSFGYACLSAMRQFAEWGTINRRELEDNPKIWEVPEENWTFTGPEQIDIQKVE
jgi:hypothetical protein